MPGQRYSILFATLFVASFSLTFAQQPTRESSPPAKPAEQKAKQSDAKEKAAPAGKDTNKEKEAEKEKPKASLEKKPAPRDPEIQALLLDAYLCPPEFAANALIRLAQSSRVQDKDWKRELLEEAFNLASGAQEPMRRKAMIVTGIRDSRPQMISDGYMLGLDELTLKCQVVNALLGVDKSKAVDLFKRIEPPRIKPTECEEIFIAEPYVFYETLVAVANATFTQKEIARGEVVAFVRPFLYAITSPTQVHPIADALRSLPASDSQFRTLMREFTTALEKVSGDDNAFSETLMFVNDRIYNLAEACQKRNLSRDDLLMAYRTYLVKNLSGSRCAAKAGSKTTRQEKRVVSYVELFNDKIRHLNEPSQKVILPITPDEIKPAEVRGYCDETLFWQAATAKEFLLNFKKLRFSETQRKSEAERESPDWQLAFQKYLGELTAWEGKDEKSDAEVFHQKVILLMGLTEDAPNEKLREAAIREMIRLLNSSLLYRDSRLEWFVIADRMIRSHEKGRATIFAELKESRNPVLSLYARLEEIAPRKTR